MHDHLHRLFAILASCTFGWLTNMIVHHHSELFEAAATVFLDHSVRVLLMSIAGHST